MPVGFRMCWTCGVARSDGRACSVCRRLSPPKFTQ
jgi:hypothetical protein